MLVSSIFDFEFIDEALQLPTKKMYLASVDIFKLSLLNFCALFVVGIFSNTLLMLGLIASFAWIYVKALSVKTLAANTSKELVSDSQIGIFKHMDARTYSEILNRQSFDLKLSYGLFLGYKLSLILVIVAAVLLSIASFSLSASLGFWAASFFSFLIFVPWGYLALGLIFEAHKVNQEIFRLSTEAALDKLYEISPLRA